MGWNGKSVPVVRLCAGQQAATRGSAVRIPTRNGFRSSAAKVAKRAEASGLTLRDFSLGALPAGEEFLAEKAEVSSKPLEAIRIKLNGKLSRLDPARSDGDIQGSHMGRG